MAGFADDLEEHTYCYLTTVGRVSGQPHRIEIWFAIIGGLLFVNSGGRDRSDWAKNLLANPALEVEVGELRCAAVARPLDDGGEHLGRRRLAERYQSWQPGQALSGWATESLLFEIEMGAVGTG